MATRNRIEKAHGITVLRRAAVFNDGASTVGYDSSNIFATNHPDITGGATNTNNYNNPNTGAANSTNFEVVLRGMDTWRDWDGEPMDVSPKILLCASGQLSNILRLVQSRGSLDANINAAVVNVFQGLGQPMVWKRLTANEWYIVTDVSGLIYQLRKALQVTQEGLNAGDSFLRDVYTWKVTKRWATKVINWRFATKGD